MRYKLGERLPNPMEFPPRRGEPYGDELPFDHSQFVEAEDEEYNLFADPDYLFEVAKELAQEEWDRIKAEKGEN